MELNKLILSYGQYFQIKDKMDLQFGMITGLYTFKVYPVILYRSV